MRHTNSSHPTSILIPLPLPDDSVSIIIIVYLNLLYTSTCAYVEKYEYVCYYKYVHEMCTGTSTGTCTSMCKSL